MGAFHFEVYFESTEYFSLMDPTILTHDQKVNIALHLDTKKIISVVFMFYAFK